MHIPNVALFSLLHGSLTLGFFTLLDRVFPSETLKTDPKRSTAHLVLQMFLREVLLGHMCEWR